MPKNTRSGVSYDGYVDVSPADRTQPEWAEPTPEPAPEPVPQPKVEDKPKRGRRPKGDDS